MGKGTATLASVLKEQWARVWNMWEELIRVIPNDEWRTGDVDYLIPARHLIHVLGCDDAFSRDTPLDQYDHLKLFGVGEWDPPSELPGKEVVLARLADIRVTVGERLDRLDDAALLEPEQVHLWAGQTRLGKLLYVLRHSQHHLGELEAELCRRGIKGALWEKDKAAMSGSGRE